MADQFSRAPDRVAKAEWRLLAGEAHGPGFWQIFRQKRELGFLAPLRQSQLELELAVEVIFDHALVPARNEDEMLDAGLARLIHHVLDKRPVDHRKHFLGHRLGCRQKAGSKASNRKYGLTDASREFLAAESTGEGRASSSTLRKVHH